MYIVYSKPKPINILKNLSDTFFIRVILCYFNICDVNYTVVIENPSPKIKCSPTSKFSLPCAKTCILFFIIDFFIMREL